MKKGVYKFALTISLLFVWLMPGVAIAQQSQSPGTWASNISIQNIGTGDATVTINFYDSSGTLTQYTHPDTIPTGGDLTLYIDDISTLGNGQYSAVVSSNQEILVVANLTSSTPYTAGAYSGFNPNETAVKLYFPGTYNNYYTFYSEVVIQNTESTNASVTLTFVNNFSGVVHTLNSTIPGNTSKVFALDDITTTPALTSGNNALFGVEVEATTGEKLAGLVNVWSSQNNGQFSDYGAYVTGTIKAFAPALYNEYYNFVSSLTVQNLDPVNNAIGTITYSNGEVVTFDLAPRKSIEYYQPNNADLPSGNTNGVYSAQIDVTSGSIVALVNTRGLTDGTLCSYNGPSAGSIDVDAPIVMHEYLGGWFSAVTVQNVGSTTTDVKISYSTGETDTFSSIPPNGTVNILQMSSVGTSLPAGSRVSAVVESVGGVSDIIAIVQENCNDCDSANPGDYLMAYTATP